MYRFSNRYSTKWPYFKNMSFLETIVSVRGSNVQNNSTGDFADNNEYVSVVSAK